jgi:hypothetical protein
MVQSLMGSASEGGRGSQILGTALRGGMHASTRTHISEMSACSNWLPTSMSAELGVGRLHITGELLTEAYITLLETLLPCNLHSCCHSVIILL